MEIHIEQRSIETLRANDGDGVLDDRNGSDDVASQLLQHLPEQHGNEHLIFNDENPQTCQCVAARVHGLS